MTADVECYALLLRHAELCREIAAAMPTLDAAELCEHIAVEFDKLAEAANPYDVEPLIG